MVQIYKNNHSKLHVSILNKYDTHYANRGLRNPQAPAATLAGNAARSLSSTGHGQDFCHQQPEECFLELSQDTGLSLKESLDFQDLVLRHSATDLELGHLGDSLLESLYTAVVVIWPGEGDIPQ